MAVIFSNLNRARVLPYLLLFLVAAILLFIGLKDDALKGSTEPRVAGVATEMSIYKDFLLPKLNGRPFLEKPPLHAWLTSLSFSALDVSAVTARLVSILAGIGTLFLVMNFLLRHGFRQPLPLYAALALLTMASCWGNARLVGEDTLLSFGIALALLNLYDYSLHQRWQFLPLIALGIAIASLTKGVFGLVVPLCVGGVYLLLKMLIIDRAFSWKMCLSSVAVIVIGLLPIGIWLWLLYEREGWWAFNEIVWVNSFGRFIGEYHSGGHVEPWYYYIAKLPELFQPWLVVVCLGIYQAFKKFKTSPLDLFLLCWVCVPFLLLSLSSGKRPVYLLSLYPAAALLMAGVFNEIFTRQEKIQAYVNKNIKKVFMLQGIVVTLIIAYGWKLAAHYGVFAADMKMLICLALLVFATLLIIYMWRFLYPEQEQKFIAANIVILCLFYTFFGSVIQPKKSMSESLDLVFDEVKKMPGCCENIALYQPIERLSGAAVFHLQKKVPELTRIDELNAFLATSANAMVITEKAEILNVSREVKRIDLKKTHYYVVQK